MTFDELQTVIMLLVAMVALTAVARRLLVPYPILLVVGGLVLGVVPGLPAVRLAPELVFLVFLPPILWAAAYFTSLRDFRANLRPIGLLAFGLVLATTAAVALVARAVVPGLGWAGAVALGAIVSPPDAVAATAIARRLRIPHRVVTILEGESLVNDAGALVLYRAAVAVAAGGTFSLGEGLLQFAFAAAAGVAIGLAVGALARRAVRLADDSFSEIAITLIAPYLAWILAEQLHAGQLHASAVLACVAGGLYVRQHFSALVAPATRLQARAVWEFLVFLLNGLIFILIGLQLGTLRDAVPPGGSGALLRQCAAVGATAIGARLVWVPVATWLPRVLSPSLRARDPMPPWSSIVLVAWTGMRGIVSLAAALALPLATGSGAPFPFREEIILITFGVILTTLVLQGLSLAPLIRALQLREDQTLEAEETLAREQAAAAALRRLEALGAEPWVVPEHLERLRTRYRGVTRRFSRIGGAPGVSAEAAAALRRLRHEALTAERLAVIDLRDRGTISDEVLHRIEGELDVEAMRIGAGDLRVPG